jgi:GT2 family glycosyltransferase
VGGIQAADGFFLACNKDVLKEVTFDAELCNTFHLYDVDWTYRAYLAGVRIGVANDLYLAHASTGGYGDPHWRPQADRWMAKYGKQLPAHRTFQYALISMVLPDMAMAMWMQDELLSQIEE